MNSINIISNDCVGARYYNVNSIQFNNPFMWSSIYFDDYVKLLENYNTINLQNAEFIYDTACERSNGKSCLCKIDSLVDIHYIHFVKDETKAPGVIEKPNSVDRICLDPIQYTKDKYYERLDRMSNASMFLFTTYYCHFNHDIGQIKQGLIRLKQASEQSNTPILCLVDESYKINLNDLKSNIFLVGTYNKSDYIEGTKRNDIHFLKNLTPKIQQAITQIFSKVDNT